jgi:hypothetical protein
MYRTVMAVLLSAGVFSLSTTLNSPIASAADEPKCNMATVVGELLSKRGNEPVKDLHESLLKGVPADRLAELKKETNKNFYPPVESPNRAPLITRFEDGIKNNQRAFEDFLQDLVSARDVACENCRWLDQWTLAKRAGFPLVTPQQLRRIPQLFYVAIKGGLDSLDKCKIDHPPGPDQDVCMDLFTTQVNNALGDLRTGYGENGYEGGAQFQDRLKNLSRKRNCFKRTDEPLGP